MRAVETIGAVATVLGIIVIVGKGLRGLLTAFHNEHVQPALTTVVHAIQTNTDETRALTSALAKTNEAQERGFERMGDIIADHEKQLGMHAVRLDHHEEALGAIRRPVAKSTATRRKP